jgi:transcriptional regulator with XRE-family HTH domain
MSDESPLALAVRRRIRQLRRDRGLTQEELCERAGISVDAVTRIESGSRVPTLSTLDAIAGALGVPVAALLAGAPEPRKRQSAVVGRVVALLESEPADVQLAAERILRAVLGVLRGQRRR